MTLQLHPAVWERVMVLSPHPDDATLATGGLLQQALARGAAIHVVFITNGDNNPWLQRVSERRWRMSQADRIRWGLQRRIEALAAFATLGVPSECATFLGYRDHGLTRILFHEGEQLSERLASLVREWRPSLLSDAHYLSRLLIGIVVLIAMDGAKLSSRHGLCPSRPYMTDRQTQ